jgi:NMD protein affecting ribosome stability and mRNA decay
MRPAKGRPSVALARDNPQDAQRATRHKEDPYLPAAKPAEPTVCPTCKAVFAEGRWSVAAPARRRRRDELPRVPEDPGRFPGRLRHHQGEFIKEHRDEIIAVINSKEDREKAEHPLQRIMAIEDVSGGLQVTTTDSHLARGIGEALHDAYKGDLKLRYSRDENLLRAIWKR